MKTQQIKSVVAQRGVALFISLIFLLVLTILGLAAVRATTQQVRMAANAQFQSAAFQAAETAIRMTMAQIGTVLPNAVLLPQVVAPTFPSDPNLAASATTTFVGANFPVDGVSASAAPGGLIGVRFDIVGAAQYGSTSASSTQRQGVQITARNPN